jgi:hypothetical protein
MRCQRLRSPGPRARADDPRRRPSGGGGGAVSANINSCSPRDKRPTSDQIAQTCASRSSGRDVRAGVGRQHYAMAPRVVATRQPGPSRFGCRARRNEARRTVLRSAQTPAWLTRFGRDEAGRAAIRRSPAACRHRSRARQHDCTNIGGTQAFPRRREYPSSSACATGAGESVDDILISRRCCTPRELLAVDAVGPTQTAQ